MNFHTPLTKLMLRIAFAVLIAGPAMTTVCAKDDAKNVAAVVRAEDAAAKALHGQKPSSCNICDCDNDLRIKKLCVDTLVAECIEGEDVTACCLDSEKISARHLCSHKIKACEVNADYVNVNTRICTSQIDAQVANLETMNVNNMCVSGSLRANSATICNDHRATMIFSTLTTYTLGTTVDWDVILDNPAGEASLIPVAHYTAPVSGYYIVTIQIGASNVTPTSGDGIFGVPVGNPQILVNNVIHRESFAPFLTFLNVQHTTLTALVKLNAGEEVTTRYNVLIMDQVAGFQPLVGTADLDGNGTDENRSIFKIILIGADCVDLPCIPVEACQSHFDTHCEPCCH